jgi:hypothetical protein
MPPLIFSPLIKLAFGALGAGAIVHWAVKEVRRINDDLDRVKRASTIDPVARQALPTLRAIPAPVIGARPDGRSAALPDLGLLLGANAACSSSTWPKAAVARKAKANAVTSD